MLSAHHFKVSNWFFKLSSTSAIARTPVTLLYGKLCTIARIRTPQSLPTLRSLLSKKSHTFFAIRKANNQLIITFQTFV